MNAPLRLWNTLGKTLSDIRPSHPDGTVRIYHCGPTVYASPHIGNLRRFITADILVRTLRFLGYDVWSVMNITDVGHLLEADHAAAGTDRMLLAAEREKVSPMEVAAKYTQEFFDALTALHAEPAQYYPRATMYIPQMIDFTQHLLDRGVAYETPSGIYLDVTKIKEYGKLSGNTLEALASGARVDVREDKRHPADFALWIKAPKAHLMQWDSPWGRGYPGWHIECSTMAMHKLGPTLDIHTGGEDNIFPHHENEIAQSESATGKPFAHIWMHNAHLLVDGQKMSKSAGTFVTLQDVVAQKYDPLAFRLLILQTHYRSKLNFSWQSLDATTTALRTLRGFIRDLRHANNIPEKSTTATPAWDLSELDTKFSHALADDLGTPQAVALLFDLIHRYHGNVSNAALSQMENQQLLAMLRKWDRVLSLLNVDGPMSSPSIPANVQKLVEEREDARVRKDFEAADSLRKKIREAGFEVEDTPSGPRVSPTE